jgi:hypothetical protein
MLVRAIFLKKQVVLAKFRRLFREFHALAVEA